MNIVSIVYAIICIKELIKFAYVLIVNLCHIDSYL